VIESFPSLAWILSQVDEWMDAFAFASRSPVRTRNSVLAPGLIIYVTLLLHVSDSETLSGDFDL
jgi:hypothetical protein